MEAVTETAVDVAVIIGFVNAVTIFYHDASSRAKIVLALVAAVVLTFIPIAPQLAKIIDLVFGSSGAYKALQVVGTVRK